MHLAYLVRDSGIEQHALGRRGLARINMGHDANIAVTLDGGCAGHDKISGFLGFIANYQR
jgi:hypothetical protein